MIAEEIHNITQALPAGVRLVAVSKYHPADAIREAYAAGQRLFGESHAQELQRKHQELTDLSLEWHFIGRLQTNKVKYIAPYVHLIHSMDSPHLLAEINKQALKAGRTIPCLLQLHVAQEETKFGFSADECTAMLEQGDWKNLKNITIGGVMGMATNTDDEAQVCREFGRLKEIFDTYKQKYFAGVDTFNTISAGMSGDYELAIRAGSNMVRIGSAIFGERNYNLNK